MVHSAAAVHLHRTPGEHVSVMTCENNACTCVLVPNELNVAVLEQYVDTDSSK